MKKILGMILVFALPVFTLASCGGGDSGEINSSVSDGGSVGTEGEAGNLKREVIMGNPNDEIYDFEAEGISVRTEGAELYGRVPYEDRVVGLAYTTWHQTSNWNGVWDQPEYGAYSSLDIDIIRKHAEMIYDAGVDFIWIDWSNDVNYTYPSRDRNDFYTIEHSTYLIFEEYSKMEKSPKISIFIGCPDESRAAKDGRLDAKADQIYNDFVLNEEYNRLLQYHNGKPLLVVYAGTPTVFSGKPKWDDERFTVRFMTGFITEQESLRDKNMVSKYGYWSWEDRGAQTFTVNPENGLPESMIITAATRRQGEPGEDWYIPEAGRRDGMTFKEQWARAREIGVQFAMVGTFNEWVLGEQPSVEVSKDLEPSAAYGDKYMKLLKEEIDKFKGYTAVPLR